MGAGGLQPPGGGAGAAAAAAAGAGGLPEGVLAGLGREVGASAEAAFAPPNIIGDMSPLGFRSFQTIGPPGQSGPPGVPGSGGSAVPYPTVRAFKISENQSPRPQDRFYFDFNFYNNVNKAANAFDGVPIKNMQAYRYLFGFEKTFDAGMGSFGLRFPINNLTADPISRPGFQSLSTPTRTAVGNLDVYAKYILKQNRQTGSLISAGLLVSAPTGPGRFAGAPYIHGLNDVSFQPFLGYICNRGDWYFQGFSGFYFPTIVADTTLMYNDLAVGYFLLRNDDPGAWLSAVVPSLEAHINTPFTHTNWHNRLDIASAPTVVSLTWGLNFQFQRSAILSCGYVLPVTNPQPFTGEFALLLNIFYGRTRAGLIPVTPPPTL
jgi:hypothetical protein